MRYRYSGGFTLLELILVMFVVGFAVTLAAVSMSRSYEKNALRQDAMRVQALMRHARERSLMERAPVSFALSGEDGAFWLEKEGAVSGKILGLHEGVRISGEPVIFFPMGNSSGGAVTLSQEDKGGYLVSVDQVTGAPSLGRL